VQGDASPFAGIAFALVAAGLPAVIAMQSKVRDDSAIRFTERLYRRLSAGDPIEAAVADARRALSIDHPTALEWASPVLFMRGERPSVVQSKPAKRRETLQPQPTVNVTNSTRTARQVTNIGIQNVYGRGKAGDA
jgi:CHAT domain-containing protein